MALGPDGNVWYADTGRRAVGRITPTGQIAQLTMPVELAGGARNITTGPDRSIWLLGRGTSGQPDWVLRVGLNGEVAKFAIGADAGLDSITAGPDGNLWFTEVGGHIGRITPSGQITEFNLPIPGVVNPRGITTGPDGALWFTAANGVGRVTTAGHVDAYPIGNDPSLPLRDIASGPDGNLWFTEYGALWHISQDGQHLVYVPLPDGSKPGGLVSGPDRNIWFTDQGNNSIARVSPTGAIREFRLPRRGVGIYGITVGADGRIWFTADDLIGSIGVKVPEARLNQRVMIFADTAPKTVTVTNTGDATLTFGRVRVTGVDSAVFTKSADTCSGKSLEPGARCEVTTMHSAGGPDGAQSAFLEVADNATGSPQKISLVAQLGTCQLPVAVFGPNTPAQGNLLDMTTGRMQIDPNGGFAASADIGGLETTSAPILHGQTSGYFDAAAKRWLPVLSADNISPDGSRYTYVSFAPNTFGQGQVHVVDIATGRDRVLPVKPSFWSVVAFGARGIYLHATYEGVGPGVILVDPDTGSAQEALHEGVVNKVVGSTAWVGVWNPADKLPQMGMGGGSNEIDKRDLATGATTQWFYASGSLVFVVGMINGWPVINAMNGPNAGLFLVRAPNQAEPLTLPFEVDRYPQGSGFVSDRPGVWIGSTEGLYLWTPRTGAVLVSSQGVTPAGTCG